MKSRPSSTGAVIISLTNDISEEIILPTVIMDGRQGTIISSHGQISFIQPLLLHGLDEERDVYLPGRYLPVDRLFLSFSLREKERV
jgi:hypothetical protein